jgi:outer membrane protein assembly factor BamB
VVEAEALPYGRSGSPLVAGDLVVVPAGGPPDGRKVSLVAYDKKTGERVWEGGDQQISCSSPTLATLLGVEQVVIVNESSVSGHDVATGAVLWQHPWGEGRSNANANVSQAMPLPPDRVFLSKGYGIGAALIELRLDGGDFAVEEIWHANQVMRTKFTNPAIHDGYVYGLSDGILESIDLATGERMWKAGRYRQGQVLRVGDLLLVVAESGEVSLVEATPERRNHVLGSFQAVEGKTWNNPALYGPYLLVRNSAEAACYKLPLA